MTLNGLAKEIHSTSVDNEFWQGERNFGEIISLIHSELSEAFEEYRKRRFFNGVYFGTGPVSGLQKPEGIPIELADVIIRVLDFMHYAEIDIDAVIAQKMKYNRNRPYRHGNLKA